MRTLTLFFVAITAVAQAPAPYKAVGTMSQLMIDIIYPTSDALFYIERTPPKTDADWGVIRQNALTLAEAGNLLMMPSRAWDSDGFVKDAKLLVDAGAAAYKLAAAKDLKGIVELNDQLYVSCVTCHQDYRPNYGRRR